MNIYKLLINVFALYFLSIQISNAENTSVVPINYKIIDAQYSKSLDKVISISSNPSRLHIYNPINHTEKFVKLPLSPISLSISPNGLFAAVVQRRKLSYINLYNSKLIKTIPISVDVDDVALSNNGIIYYNAVETPEDGSNVWSFYIKIINIYTNKIVKVSGIDFGSTPKLAENGKVMYGMGLDGVEKYNIGLDTINKITNGLYQDVYSLCADLWISENGLRIFTSCGDVLSIISGNQSYYGRINSDYSDRLKKLSDSKKYNKLAAIYEYYDTYIKIYNYENLELENDKLLPEFLLKNKKYESHADYLFYNKLGNKLFVIVQAGQNSKLLNNFGVVTYDTSITPCNPLSPNLDCDNDKILNKNDNCSLVYNKQNTGSVVQLDSDGDHYGNICDADFNNNKLVDYKDFDKWLGGTNTKSRWMSVCGNPLYTQGSDFNNDCLIDSADNNIFMSYLFKKPGPSCIDLPVKQRGNKC